MNTNLDHIIWACSDLARGMRRFEELTGIAPSYGGRHEGGATHNALIPLDGRRYVEILAPVGPAQPNDGELTRLARRAHEPRVLTYCLRSPHPLSDLAAIAQAHGWPGAQVVDNGRTSPDGARLRWRTLRPRSAQYGLAFPFFIDWLDSSHPSESPQSALGVTLQLFAVGHTDAAGLTQTLERFGAVIDTYVADEVDFRVLLRTPGGVVSL
jgi:hypothetical protein